MTTQRATSESWIDFCPKRLFDTTANSGEGWSGRKSSVNLSEADPEMINNNNSRSSRSSNAVINLRAEDTAGMLRDTPHGATAARGGVAHVAALGGKVAAASVSRASPPSHSSSPVKPPVMSENGNSRGRAPAAGPPAAGHRFDAMDYEASAILLECRSGVLLPHE